MKVLIVGYGRMGKEVDSVLRKRGHNLCGSVDNQEQADYKSVKDAPLDKADAVIEFALAEGIMDRLSLYKEFSLPVVVGTTGWDALEDSVRETYKETKAGALLKGSNFSLGAHIFFRLGREAARLLNAAREYDVAMIEYHHNAKKDYPSGTAMTAARDITSILERKTRIISQLPDGQVEPEALQVASVRLGSIAGVHEILMSSPWDSLKISHEAISRQGFAEGSVRAAEWLLGRNGYFDAEDFFNDYFSRRK